MRYVAIFEDAPEMLLIRQTRSEQHIAYLKEHRNEILIGGGLREEPGGVFVGGMWIFEVESRERAVSLIENDPYFESAYRTYRLLVWVKGLPEPVLL
jgi:uncharacterized protein YciI